MIWVSTGHRVRAHVYTLVCKMAMVVYVCEHSHKYDPRISALVILYV